MKIFIIAILFYYIFLNKSFSQISDTLFIHSNLFPVNSELNLEQNKMRINLVNNYYLFEGYLIIQLDSNSRIYDNELTVKTPIFYKNTLEKINDTTGKIYFWWPNKDLIAKYSIKYDNGSRDDLSIFFKYYFIFNEIVNNSQHSFLYNNADDSILSTKSLFLSDNIFTSKINNKIHYIFVKCKFYAAILEIENTVVKNHKFVVNQMVKVFFPISNLKEFHVIKEIDNEQFIKDGLIIKEIN
jgi:hypothetical protein